MKQRGFTLIELLIVIAIILILIAIALPNFLEAQLRARVTKTKADMRSVGTAIYTASSDYADGIGGCAWAQNNYATFLECDQIGSKPGAGIYTGWLMLHDPPGPSRFIGERLTTPVAYIQQLPLDHFNTAMSSQPPWPTFDRPASFHTNFFLPGALDGTGRPWEEFWFDFMMREHPNVRPNFWFHLNSAGPDITWWSGTPGQGKLYSPTNGTKSEGDIWYWSNGNSAP